MAINPELQYTGRVAPPTPEYPYGAARNATSPGDGTNTPWEAALVNDLFGWQQALLSAAGIAPSAAPEKATESQYLKAMLTLTSTRVVDVSGFSEQSPEDNSAHVLLGWHPGWAATAGGPQGGGMFVYSSSTPKSLHNGGTVISPTVPALDDQLGVSASERRDNFLSALGESDPSGTGCFVRCDYTDIRPDMFGTFGDGLNFDSGAFSAAVNLAIETEVKTIFTDYSHRQKYLFNETVSIESSGFKLRGNGFARYNLDGRAASGGLEAVGETGYITGVSGLDALFDYGNGRGDLTSSGFHIDGMQMFGADKLVVNAVKITQDNNGPHRGMTITNSTFEAFVNGVLFDAPTALTVAATVDVYSSCFRECSNALLSNNVLFQFRYVGNQSEQGGKLTGTFNAGITITDNMLEGQSEPLDMVVGFGQTVLENNYFEINTGGYLARFSSTGNATSIKLGRNQIINPQTTDFYRLAGDFVVSEEAENPQSFLEGKTRRASITGEGLRALPGSKMTGRLNLVTSEIASRTKASGLCTPNALETTRPDSAEILQALGPARFETPYGLKVGGFEGAQLNSTHNLTYAAGDAITVCALVNVSEDQASNITLTTSNETLGALGITASIIHTLNAAGWHILFATGVVTDSGAVFYSTIDAGVQDIKVAAIGAYVTQQADFESYNSTSRPYVELFNPFLGEGARKTIANINPGILNSGDLEVRSQTMSGVEIGDHILASFSNDLNGVLLNAWVSSPGNVRYSFYNQNPGGIDLAPGDVELVVVN